MMKPSSSNTRTIQVGDCLLLYVCIYPSNRVTQEYIKITIQSVFIRGLHLFTISFVVLKEEEEKTHKLFKLKRSVPSSPCSVQYRLPPPPPPSSSWTEKGIPCFWNYTFLVLLTISAGFYLSCQLKLTTVGLNIYFAFTHRRFLFLRKRLEFYSIKRGGKGRIEKGRRRREGSSFLSFTILLSNVFLLLPLLLLPCDPIFFLMSYVIRFLFQILICIWAGWGGVERSGED